MSDIGPKGLILRNFTLAEHDIYTLESQLDKDTADEHLIKRCTLWPDDFDLDELSIAAAGVILNKLNEVSPFDNPERFFRKLEQKRSEVNTPKGQMCAYVIAAFPGMALAKVKQLHFDELMEHVALAERILGQTIQLGPEGELQAVPEQGMSPAQLEQIRKRQAYDRKKARREQELEQYKLSRAASMPKDESTQASVPENSLLKDKDDIQKALFNLGADRAGL